MYPDDLGGSAGLDDNVVPDVKSDRNGIDELVVICIITMRGWITRLGHQLELFNHPSSDAADLIGLQVQGNVICDNVSGIL